MKEKIGIQGVYNQNHNENEIVREKGRCSDMVAVGVEKGETGAVEG